MLITGGRRVLADSLARNSLLIMATTVTNGGLGYFYWMVAARAVPQYEIGTSTALISAATAISMIANLGAGHMFIQRLPGAGARDWSRIVGSGLIAGTGVTAAAATAGALIVPEVAGNFAFLAGFAGAGALICAAVAVTLTMLLDNVYVAHRAGHGMLVRNLALASGKIIALLAVLSAGSHSAGAVLLSWTVPTLLVNVGTLVAGLPRLRPLPCPADLAGGPRTRGEPGRLRDLVAELPHLRSAVTGHHLINLTQAGPAALLPVLVTVRLGSDANAHFYLAWMTASMLFMVSPAVASALYAERTNAARVSVTRAAVVVLAVVGFPATVLLAGGDRILGLFSPGYADGGSLLLTFLVIAALPDAVTNLAVAHWRSRGLFRRCRRLNAVRALTCLSLTWLLLPGTGVPGAGVAWLAGQSAAAVLVALLAVSRRFTVAPRPLHAAGSRTPDGAGAGGGHVLDGSSPCPSAASAVAEPRLPGTAAGAVVGGVAVPDSEAGSPEAGGRKESRWR